MTEEGMSGASHRVLACPARQGSRDTTRARVDRVHPAPGLQPSQAGRCFRAAAAWFRYTDPDVIRDDLTFELEEMAALRSAYVDTEAAKTIRMLDRRPTRAELERRRREAKTSINPEPWTGKQLGLDSVRPSAAPSSSRSSPPTPQP